MFEGFQNILIVYVVEGKPFSVLKISADLEYVQLEESLSLESSLQFFGSHDGEIKYIRVVCVSTHTPSIHESSRYCKGLQSLRKSEQIMAIESLHDCLSELRRHQFDPLKSPDQHDFPSPSKSDTFLRDSFVQDLLQSTESEDLASFGVRAYKALRENVFSQKNWNDPQYLLEDEISPPENFNANEDCHPRMLPQEKTTEEQLENSEEYIYVEEDGKIEFQMVHPSENGDSRLSLDGDRSSESFVSNEQLISRIEDPVARTSREDSDRTIVLARELADCVQHEADHDSPCHLPSPSMKDVDHDKCGLRFSDLEIELLLKTMSSVQEQIFSDRALRQEKKSQRRIELGKELFFRMQAAAAAKRRKQGITGQLSSARVPPLPQWIDNSSAVRSTPGSPKRDVISQINCDGESQIAIKNQANESKADSSFHHVNDSKTDNEQTYQERKNHIQAKETNVTPADGDLLTVVTEKSSFSAGAQPHPKGTKLIITEESNFISDEQKNRKLQRLEMMKKRKASGVDEKEGRIVDKHDQVMRVEKPDLEKREKQSAGYLRHHLEKCTNDEEILKLENEVALLNPPSAKSAKSSHTRGKSADPAARRPQPSAPSVDVEKSQLRAHSAGRAARHPGNRANFQQIRNALMTVCLAGPHQTAIREETLSAMDNYLDDGGHVIQFIIVMHQSKMLSFKGLYAVDGATSEIRRLSGRGPRILPPTVIEEYYKYESATRSFRKLPTLSLNSTCDAVTVDPTKLKKIKS